MFLRRCHRRKNGKTHTYWALMESVRIGGQSRQRLVAYLGHLKRKEKNGWEQLGRRLDRKDRPSRTLFDPPSYPEPAEEVRLVPIRGVGLERTREFGDVWLARGLWRLLGLEDLLTRLMPAGREEVPWPAVAAILVIARFCEPGSELHIEDTWYRRTALEDLVGVRPEQVHTNRLYGGLDQLWPLKEAIEKHLKERLGDLFDLEYDLLLYDITSTYFEGTCAGNAMAKRGYSRDSRPDCVQVCIGLVVTTDGMPLGYEVFDGNTGDSTTVERMVAAMEAKYGAAHRIWVMDRGMVSEANLAYLRGRGAQYIVGTPKRMLRRFEQHLTGQDWQAVQAGVEVKLVPGPEGEEVFILARSADRREKEKAMHARFVERLEAGLVRLQAAAVSGRLKDVETGGRRLGRLHERYWRAARAFEVRIAPIDPPAGKARVSVAWTRREDWRQWAEASEGCYLLRTNLTGTDAGVLWKQYIQLTEAEWAFRIEKDELSIRPIWHQTAERVQAHILVCFLAYGLWKALAQWMRGAGLGDAPRTVVDEFRAITSGDVLLPTRTADGRPGRTVRVRCVTTPDGAQKVLLNRLGLTLPRHLRTFEEVAHM